jgi:hypothetical protein
VALKSPQTEPLPLFRGRKSKDAAPPGSVGDKTPVRFCNFPALAAALVLLALGAAAAPPARAETFIGFGQPSLPESWALRASPTYQRTAPDARALYSAFSAAYFTRTGFTGTERDRFQFEFGGMGGYASTLGAPGASAYGWAAPGLGFEYYYHVIVPDRPLGAPGYTTFWTNPALAVFLPNGNHKNAGFGAGANQYSIALNWQNYLQRDRWAITFSPLQLSWAARNLNETDLGHGLKTRFKGGLSATFMEVAAGYAVRDDLVLGLHHDYSIYNWKGSNLPQSRQGRIGPAFAWLGLAKYGVFIFGNLNRDYHVSANHGKSTSVALTLVQVFK